MHFCRQAILLRLFLLESSKQIFKFQLPEQLIRILCIQLSQPRFIPVKHHRTVDADRRKIETQICQIFIGDQRFSHRFDMRIQIVQRLKLL